MNIKIFTILFFTVVKVSFSQSVDDSISNTNFNHKFLEHLIKVKIDSVRKINNCQALINDSVLYLASKHHSMYMVENNSLSHYEDELETKTPQLRAELYGAINYSVGENVLKTNYNTVITTRFKKQINTSTYNGLANSMVTGWINSPGHFKNIITSSYQITGVSVSLDKDKNVLYACQKFASVQYKYRFKEYKYLFPYSNYEMEPIVNSFEGIPNNLTSHDHQWGLKHDNIEKCNKCDRVIQKKPEITLRYENNYFILKIENSEYVKQLIQNKYDGFAVEIVEFNDYMCGNPVFYNKPSRRNNQCRVNGKVIKPLYRENLYRGYKRRRKKKDFSFLSYIFGADSVNFFDRFNRYKIEKYSSEYFEINLGKLPKDIVGEWNHNLIYIQDKHICNIDYFTNYCGEPYEYYQESDFVFAVSKDTFNFKLDKKELVFTIPFKKSETIIEKKDIDHFYSSLSKLEYSIDSINIKAFSSVEGDSISNKELQINRAKSIVEVLKNNQTDSVNTKIEVYSNWEHFYKTIKRSKKWNFLASYKKEVLQELINKKYADSLEYILENERKAIVRINYTIDLKDENLEYYILKEQKTLIDALNKQSDFESSNFKKLLSRYQRFYSFVHWKIIEGKVDTSIIVKLEMPNAFYYNTKLSEQYLLNAYQFPNYLKEKVSWGQHEKDLTKVLFEERFTELSTEFIYNYSKIYTDNLIEHSQASKQDIENIFKYLQFIDSFRDLNNEIEININKVIHNLNIILLNRVFNADMIMYSDDAKNSILQLISVYHNQQNYSDSLSIQLAKTAVYYKNINLALEILRPFDGNDKVLAYILPLNYQHNSFDTKNNFYKVLLEKSYEMDEDLWCNMFLNECGIPFQALDNEKIRNVFCEKCLHTNEFIKKKLE